MVFIIYISIGCRSLSDILSVSLSICYRSLVFYWNRIRHTNTVDSYVIYMFAKLRSLFVKLKKIHLPPLYGSQVSSIQSRRRNEVVGISLAHVHVYLLLLLSLHLHGTNTLLL